MINDQPALSVEDLKVKTVIRGATVFVSLIKTWQSPGKIRGHFKT